MAGSERGRCYGLAGEIRQIMGLGQGLRGAASVSKVRAKMVNPSLENFNPMKEQKMSSREFLLETSQ